MLNVYVHVYAYLYICLHVGSNQQVDTRTDARPLCRNVCKVSCRCVVRNCLDATTMVGAKVLAKAKAVKVWAKVAANTKGKAKAQRTDSGEYIMRCMGCNGNV